MLWGIDWRIVQRMLIDGPKYDAGKGGDQGDGEDEIFDLTEETTEDMVAKLKHLFG